MRSNRLAAAVLAAGCALALPLPSRGYTLRETEGGQTVRWHDGERSVRVDESLRRLVGHRDARQTVLDAFTSWSTVDGSPFDFDCDKELRHEHDSGRRTDGISDVSAVDEDWEFDPSFVAITLVTYDAGSGQIWDADVLVNADQYELGVDELGASQYDLASVLTHEVGHLVGLGHSEVEDATMYASTQPGEVERSSLATDDVQGLQALYLGQEMDGAGCSIAPRGPGGNAVLGWLVVGAVAWRARRRGTSPRPNGAGVTRAGRRGTSPRPTVAGGRASRSRARG